jgi:hypothetical protein
MALRFRQVFLEIPHLGVVTHQVKDLLSKLLGNSPIGGFHQDQTQEFLSRFLLTHIGFLLRGYPCKISFGYVDDLALSVWNPENFMSFQTAELPVVVRNDASRDHVNIMAKGRLLRIPGALSPVPDQEGFVQLLEYILRIITPRSYPTSKPCIEQLADFMPPLLKRDPQFARDNGRNLEDDFLGSEKREGIFLWISLPRILTSAKVPFKGGLRIFQACSRDRHLIDDRD